MARVAQGNVNPDHEAAIVGKMAKLLASDIRKMEQQALSDTIKTFLHYNRAREAYLSIQGLISTITERIPAAEAALPDGFATWVIRCKLRALSAFTRICHGFFRNPPLTLTHSLGAWDILSEERRNFDAVMQYFDSMIMEAGIDDKTADALEETRVQIEDILGMLEQLLTSSPKRLEEFE
ncbi:MAG: hypothetical protein P4M00_07425 [Azospirillaceae bacterium]|nr:hypothetical protein [Azospirillaceae bacterium]